MGTILSVRDNFEKHRTIKYYMNRYNKAYNAGFYLECLWLLYAMIEDRTSAFLYHIGFTQKENRQKATGTRKIRLQIRKILNMNANDRLYFRNLGRKLDLITEVFDWVRSDEKCEEPYSEYVKSVLTKLARKKENRDCLERLNNDWRDKRNQLTHALMSKDLFATLKELKTLVESGHNQLRVFDNMVDYIKNRRIRKKFNIQ